MPPNTDFQNTCLDAMAALTEIADRVESDEPIYPNEWFYFASVMLSIQYLHQQVDAGGGGDSNPYKYDDDHTFY